MRLAICTAMMVCGLMADALAAGDSLTGSWYPEGVENGLRAQFIVQNGQDGAFRKSIRDVTDCKNPHTWTESGSWSLEGTTYKETTRTVDGNPVDSSLSDYRDAFTVSWSDRAHFSLYDPKTQITWRFEKVPADFRMPASGACSV